MIMKNYKIIYPMLRYIEEHLEEELASKMMASEAGYSEYYFMRVFKACMEMTVMEYVCKRRLIRASEEILMGKRVIDVALKYTWESHSGFTKAFKKEFGFCPSILRAMKITVENLGGSDMSHVFLESIKIGATKEELIEILQEKLQKNGVAISQNELNVVYQEACSAYQGVKRYSGEEYITHLLNVSIILTELGATADVILAGMFCDVSRKGVVSLDGLNGVLPKDIYDIVVKVQHTTTEWSEMSEEVVLIKLAERLHNMRTIEYMDERKKRKKATETIKFFMPLARKLGNQKLIDELSDLSLRTVINS